MEIWQRLIVILFGLFSIIVFLKGVNESLKKNNSYAGTIPLLWMGIFVWGDAVVYGAFWALCCFTVLLLNDWLLFLLLFSVYWTVRSLGETIFWFNQQFTPMKLYHAPKLPGYKFFNNESIYFIYQIFCQCITVVSLITTIYLSAIWLQSRF